MKDCEIWRNGNALVGAVEKGVSGMKKRLWRLLGGHWPANDLRRAFVEGAKWWEWKSQGATMWPSDVNEAEAEAECRYPHGKRNKERNHD